METMGFLYKRKRKQEDLSMNTTLHIEKNRLDSSELIRLAVTGEAIYLIKMY